MGWPIEYSKELLVGDLSNSVAICSLWSERKFVAIQTGMDKVAVIGNLYSHGPGIEGIVRNILSNPAIRTIVVAGKDKSSTAETLKHFFNTGVTKSEIGWAIGLPPSLKNENLPVGKRVIDSAISFDEIEKLIANVEIVDLRNKDWGEVRDSISEIEHKAPFSEPKIFPKTESKVEVLKGEDIGFVFRGNDYHNVWLEILRTIRQFGVKAESRYTNGTQEILNVVAVLDGGLEEISEDIVSYSQQLINGTTVDSEDTYAYGNRMRVRNGDQIAEVIKKLKNSPSDRGLLIDLWDVESDFYSGGANPPCMTQVWFRVFEGKLTANFYYRSHDITNAWTKNTLGDRLLQAYVANEAKLPLGRTTIISSSAHIYENDFPQVDLILKDNQRKWQFSEDPRGNFIVTTNNNQIIVRHENNSGAVTVIKGTSGETLYKEIWKRGLISLVDHSLYMGYVLSKAEIAIKNGLIFDQDKA